MSETTFQSVAAVLGNVLEWYDFATFGYFSDVIAEVFFPPSEGNDNLVKSFAIFGGAFLMRPFGGLIIGYLGDKHGRKRALVFSLFLMAIPTCAMGLLPTYERAGGLSTFLLVVCRMLQGMSVGGQLPASMIYTMEKRPREHWGYYGSFIMMAANFGSLLGNLVGASLRSILTEEQVIDYGWRIPFISGILIALVAYYLKLNGEEHHPNADVYDHKDSNVTNPVRNAVKKDNRLALFATALTPMIWGAGYYLTFVWMAIYMDSLIDPPIKNAFWVNAAALFCSMTFMLPVAGAMSDRMGRKMVMTTATIGLGLIGPGMLAVVANSKPFVAFLAQTCIGIFLSFIGGPLCAWLLENFPPEIRLTSASIGYDLAHATASAFSPLLATILVDKVGIYSPGALYTLFAGLSTIGLFTMSFARNNNVDEQGIDPEEPDPSNPTFTHEEEGATNDSQDATEIPAEKETELPNIT